MRTATNELKKKMIGNSNRSMNFQVVTIFRGIGFGVIPASSS